MLQNNNCSDKIKIFLILTFIFAYIIFLFPVLIIFLVVFFLKTDYELEKILQKFGVYDCFKKIFPGKISEFQKNIKKDYYSKSSYKNNSYKKEKSNYNSIINKNIDLKSNSELEKQNIQSTAKPKKIKYTNSNYSKPLDYNNKKTNNLSFESFKKQKSIWDDYESVIDKMNKNKLR